MKKRQSSAHDEEFWADIIRDVNIKNVPVQYLSEILVEFNNNKIWTIELHKNLSSEQYEKLEKHLHYMLTEYRENIVKVNYSININKVKKDVTSKTKKLLKKTQK